jgi:hypothetical protein
MDMVRMGEKSEVGITKEEPAVRMIAAVSPMLRPTPRIIPVKIPGRALGRIARMTVCHFVPPRE